MTLKSELMARGIAAGAAGLLAQDLANTALTAAGTTQATALAMTSNFSIFGTVAASSGAIINQLHGVGWVVNNGANTLTLYPPVGSSINGGATNAGISVPAGKSAYYASNGLNWGVLVSA
jgi:hypothetical protein